MIDKIHKLLCLYLLGIGEKSLHLLQVRYTYIPPYATWVTVCLNDILSYVEIGRLGDFDFYGISVQERLK